MFSSNFYSMSVDPRVFLTWKVNFLHFRDSITLLLDINVMSENSVGLCCDKFKQESRGIRDSKKSSYKIIE